jgi:hypothetical protein
MNPFIVTSSLWLERAACRWVPAIDVRDSTRKIKYWQEENIHQNLDKLLTRLDYQDPIGMSIQNKIDQNGKRIEPARNTFGVDILAPPSHSAVANSRCDHCHAAQYWRNRCRRGKSQINRYASSLPSLLAAAKR